MNMIKADDGDGNMDTITVTIGEAVPTPTPPGFEAVFTNFSF